MPQAGNQLKRGLLAGLGLVSLSIGIVGVFLPGLPTTVFILIALWAFSRSSERLRRSIYRLPFLKTAIAEAELFAQQRQVKRRSKIIAQTFAWAAVGIGLLLHWPLMLLLVVVAAAVGCSAFMWWVDGVPADPASQPSCPLKTAGLEEASESPS